MISCKMYKDWRAKKTQEKGFEPAGGVQELKPGEFGRVLPAESRSASGQFKNS